MIGAYLPGNSTVELKDVPVPEPGHGEVLLRMKASTICGSDIRCIYHEHLGKGPEGSTKIDASRGAAQSDINYQYKEAMARATARERAERIISRLVLSKADVTEEEAERIYKRELKSVSRKFTHMRFHSFLMYFGVKKRLG